MEPCRLRVFLIPKGTCSDISWTHLFLWDEQLVPFQHNETVFPDLPKNPFTAKLANPAGFIWLWRRLVGILQALHVSKEGAKEVKRVRSTSLNGNRTANNSAANSAPDIPSVAASHSLRMMQTIWFYNLDEYYILIRGGAWNEIIKCWPKRERLET